MTADSWIIQSLGIERVREAVEEAGRRRLHQALKVDVEEQLSDDQLRFVANGLELRVFELLDLDNSEDLRAAATEAFQVARTLVYPEVPLEVAEWLVRLGAIGVLGDRGADVRRLLIERGLPQLPLDSEDWGIRVWACIFDIWLRLFRKQGWEDLDLVQQRVAVLRTDQRQHEPNFLAQAEARKDARPAWELVAAYHLAKAAEILGVYLTQGSVDGHYDVREQLEAQFDRAVSAAGRGQLMERESLVRLLARTANVLVDTAFGL